MVEITNLSFWNKIFENIPADIIAVIIYSYVPAWILTSILTKDSLRRFILAIPFAAIISIVNGFIFIDILKTEFNPSNAMLFGFFEALLIWMYRHKITL